MGVCGGRVGAVWGPCGDHVGVCGGRVGTMWGPHVGHVGRGDYGEFTVH